MELQTQIRWHGRNAVVSVRGNLDHHTASQLELELATLAEQASAAMVVLDVHQLTFCDSSELSVFVSAHKRAEDGGGKFALAGVSDNLTRRLAVTGLIGVLAVYATASIALADAH